MEENRTVPRMMSIPAIAATGILTETALRRLVKTGEIPSLKVGNRAYINYDALADRLSQF